MRRCARVPSCASTWALEHYGMIAADNGSSRYVTGAPDPRWHHEILDQIETVGGESFEVVDTGAVVTRAAPTPP